VTLSDFHALDLADQGLVNDYLRRFPPEISEHTFTNLFAWRATRPIWLAEAMDSLVFACAAPGRPETPAILFGPPVGPASVVQILDHYQMREAIRLPAGPAELLRAAGKTPVHDRDNDDYVYLVSNLADPAGRRYAKKRNHIRQCLKKYDCTYEPMDPGNVGECIAMQKRWCEGRQCQIYPGLGDEDIAINETLRHIDRFPLLAGVIRIDGIVQAFAIAEPLNQETAVWHFEKALPDFDGLGQLITHWFARFALGSFKYVNREQDLGIPGLRQAKESNFPDLMVEKFCCLQTP
jgi:hypothetical protein